MLRIHALTIQRSLIISLSYLALHPSLRPPGPVSGPASSSRYLPGPDMICRRGLAALSPPRSEIRSALILLSPASLYLTSTLSPARPAYFRNKYLGIVNNKAQIITPSLSFCCFYQDKACKKNMCSPTTDPYQNRISNCTKYNL